MSKLYCFVDESGQDTKGKLFLVTVVLSHSEDLETLEKKLEILEKESEKGSRKWGKTPFMAKEKYIRGIIKERILNKSIFYSSYEETKNYTVLTSVTIAKTIYSLKTKNYQVRIIIDSLNEKEREKVAKELKKLMVRYEGIRGLRDEKSPLLRLADAIAGLLRDLFEKQEYAIKLVSSLKEKEILTEV